MRRTETEPMAAPNNRWRLGSAALVAAVLLGVCSTMLFEQLEPTLHAAILTVAASVTLPGFLLVVFLVRSHPLWAFGLIIGGTFMRLTALALIALWLQAKQPESLRAGLLSYLVFVCGFLLFEIVALPLSGLHRFRGNRNAPVGSAPTGKE